MELNETNILLRLMRVEAMVNYLKTGLKEDAYKGWLRAVELQDEDQADAEAKVYRRILLEETDNYALTDRGSMPAAMAEYRQALRDITNQAGYPLIIIWPENPDDEQSKNTVETV